MAHMHNNTADKILPDLDTVTLERDGHVLLIGLNRPHKRNSFDRAMLADLSRAYALLESDAAVRAGVLFAHGDQLTAGLDLADVGPGIAGSTPSATRRPLPRPLTAPNVHWLRINGRNLAVSAHSARKPYASRV